MLVVSHFCGHFYRADFSLYMSESVELDNDDGKDAAETSSAYAKNENIHLLCGLILRELLKMMGVFQASVNIAKSHLQEKVKMGHPT